MPSAAELKTAFNDFARRKGLKSTQQRDLIVDVFFHSGGHISVEELLEKVRRDNPRIGYATVYRALKLLCEAGLADERHFGAGFARYERVADHHHDHLICTECGCVEEFENPEIEMLQEKIAESFGFTITTHKHEIYGLCPACQAKGR